MICAMLLFSCGTNDEEAGATLSGTVTQSDGWYSVDQAVSAVEGATVSLKQSAITKRSATTNNSGAYLISSIDPGTYDVEAVITPSFYEHACYPYTNSVGDAPQYNLNSAGWTDVDAANYSLSNTTDGTYTITYGSLALASGDSVTLDFQVYGY